MQCVEKLFHQNSHYLVAPPVAVLSGRSAVLRGPSVAYWRNRAAHPARGFGAWIRQLGCLALSLTPEPLRIRFAHTAWPRRIRAVSVSTRRLALGNRRRNLSYRVQHRADLVGDLCDIALGGDQRRRHDHGIARHPAIKVVVMIHPLDGIVASRGGFAGDRLEVDAAQEADRSDVDDIWRVP